MSRIASQGKASQRDGVTYTVLSAGNRSTQAEDELAALVIGRGGTMYWDRLFESLYAAGIARVTYVGSEADRVRGARMSSMFPGVRILLPSRTSGTGSLVNLGMREIGSGKVIVLGSEQRLGTPFLSARIKRKIVASDAVCLCPSLEDRDGSPYPLAHIPENPEAGSHARPGIRHPPRFVPLEPFTMANMGTGGGSTESRSLLFQSDYCGVYDADGFLQLGGFDESIPDRWWQCADFGLRSWVSGRRLLGLPSLVMKNEENPVESHVRMAESDAGWPAFWLKWFGRGGLRSMPQFLSARGGRLSDSLREYRALDGRRARGSDRAYSRALAAFDAADSRTE